MLIDLFLNNAQKKKISGMMPVYTNAKEKEREKKIQNSFPLLQNKTSTPFVLELANLNAFFLFQIGIFKRFKHRC